MILTEVRFMFKRLIPFLFRSLRHSNVEPMAIFRFPAAGTPPGPGILRRGPSSWDPLLPPTGVPGRSFLDAQQQRLAPVGALRVGRAQVERRQVPVRFVLHCWHGSPTSSGPAVGDDPVCTQGLWDLGGSTIHGGMESATAGHN